MEDRSSRWVIEEEVEPETPKPEWFENAVGMAPTSHRVTVEDCPIHYLLWGPETSEKPGLLFVHGGAAHAQWWSFIAPFFAEDRPVAAIDLSGMGESGRRDDTTIRFVSRRWRLSSPMPASARSQSSSAIVSAVT